jgi:hypothetical protein
LCVGLGFKISPLSPPKKETFALLESQETPHVHQEVNAASNKISTDAKSKYMESIPSKKLGGFVPVEWNV